MKSFRDTISHSIVVGDGAMSTVLHQYGAPVRSCMEALCVTNPELVSTVHRSYVEAGATLIQTHTFGAHRTGLARYGYEGRLEDINRAAVRLARQAAGDKAYVFGTIGSIAGLSSQGLVTDEARREEMRQEFREQALVLLSEGVDGLILETFPELDELLLALGELRSLTDLPIITNLAPVTVGFTRDGVPVSEAFERLQARGSDVVGLNCELGPSNILRTFETTPRKPGALYSAVPNSGLLHVTDGQFGYTGSPEYFADIAARLVACDVRFLGGCCGTTPDHIRAVVQKIGSMKALPHTNHWAEVEVVEPSGGDGSAPASDDQGDAGVYSVVKQVTTKRTIIVELDPPKTLHVGRYLKAAVALRDAGADMLTLADNSLGSVRISNMAIASLLRQRGIEPLVHVACRDRNLIGQQSHLMGLHVLGIHNVLLVTGDPSRYGDLPGATSVYDVSSIELSRMVKRLNSGIAFTGQTLKSPSQFIVGTAFNPHVRNFDKAVERLRRKVEAGADYVMTQPVFDVETLGRIAAATKDLGVPVFIGISPLTSYRNAVFLHNEVPGMQLPSAVLQRMEKRAEGEAHLEGLAIAKELLDAALPQFQGIYLMTPFLRYELTVELTEYIRRYDARKLEPFSL